MSERKAPFLHLIRNVEVSETSATRSEGAQESELVDEGNLASPPSHRQPAPRSVEIAPSSAGDGDTTPDDRGLTPTTKPLANAVMYAAVGWLSLCVERAAVAVDIQPVADRLYEVSAHYDEERTQGIILRVRLDVEPGLVIRTTVEPVRP